uniref:Uncharacterized protein n=1 Tax=Oryza sativa subsp. japonica TaxID=39947 RepID=Q69XR0_ORYSJ|nr:hypothetical protein [Oryza sativa Japonica Group]
MEGTGGSGGKRKKVEGSAGMVYMGSGGADEAGRRPDFSPTWERWGERVGRGFESNPAHSRVRARVGNGGTWAATWGEAWGAEWAREERGKRRRCGGFGGGGGGCWRRKTGPTELYNASIY